MNARLRVLVCDDEPQILRALRVILGEQGFEVLPAATAREALDSAALRRPDAAIVDLVLPDGDGVDVCRALREWSELPIVVLSAVGDEAEKVRALNAGADDYVTKPFGPSELIARLNAALRRAAPGDDAEPVITAGGLTLDLTAHEVRLDGKPIHLTPIEFNLLRTLMLNRRRLMTHARCSPRCGAPHMRATRRRYASTWRTCDARSSVTPPLPATSQPTPGSVTGSRPDDRLHAIFMRVCPIFMAP